MGRYMGHKVIGDVHLGDWGLQMGLIITELKERQPDLVYFDENYTGEYPEEAPFTIGELEEIYPAASGKSKEDENFKERAMEATHLLQQGNRGYRALWNHIMNVSVTDLKRNYRKLDVNLIFGKGESDAQPYIPEMVQAMKRSGICSSGSGSAGGGRKRRGRHQRNPALHDSEVRWCFFYNTTDLATIVEPMKLKISRMKLSMW